MQGGEPDELEELVSEIQSIIEWEDGGHVTDWSCYPFGHAQLVTIWRKAERHVERLQQSRLQTALIGWLKPPE